MADHFARLPNELWEYLTDLVFRQDVKDAANLIQVCKLWRDSPAGQRLRYLLGLAKLSLPVPRLLPFRIAEEASVLLGSTWPLPSARAVYDLHHEQHCWDMPPPLGRPELRGSLLVDLTRDRCGLLVMATEHVARSLPPNTGPSFIPAPSHITQYDVDSDERVVVTMCEECVPYAEAPTSNDAAAAAAAATAAQIDTRSHTAPLKRLALTLHDIDSTLPRGHQLVVKQRYHIAQLELLGSHILFRLEDAVQLRNWRKNWRLVWCREPNEWPVLSAHLLGRDAVMVLSRPQTGDHGLDWASTLELYRVSQVFSRVADIQLPITSKPVRGLNYARTGTRGRLNEKEQDQSGLLVVCVDGYLWLADLASFIELLYPTSAVSLYIPGTATHPVLGTHWVRAHMTRCTLAAADKAPMQPVAVSGYRIAAVWSRSMARGQRGPRQQEGGAEAAYVRFLDCHPKLGYEGPVTSRDQRPPEQRVFTMWWRGAYAVYFDHSLETYLLSGTAAHDVHISMDAARIVLGDADRRLIVM